MPLNESAYGTCSPLIGAGRYNNHDEVEIAMQTGRLNLFDGVCTVGRHLHWKGGEPHSAQDLLDDMDRVGISEALVLDTLSRENHPAEGNRRVLEVTSSSPRLHPAWSALPHGAPGEQAGPGQMVRQMRNHGVGALFLFPVQHGFTLGDWTVDPFIEPLAGAGVPVFINYNAAGNLQLDQTRWDEVVGMCRRWPSLPVVVTEWRMRRTNRMVYRALDACPNLRVELSGYWLYHGIEYLVQEWGAHRFIFGSNWPYLNQECTSATVSMADIDDTAKQAIGGGNLRDLLNWSEREHQRPNLPDPADRFARFARSGERPEDMTFLDCHGHLGGRSREYHIPHSDLDSTVRDMDRLGIEQTFVFSFTVVHSDERYGNDLIADAVDHYPGRFVGFAGINPHRDKEEVLAELDRCERMGLRGIKLIPQYQGASPEGPLIELCCRWADERDWIILNHGWGPPEHLDRLLTAYPDAGFIAGHAALQYGPLARSHDNLWICSCPVHRPRDCEKLVEAAGAEKVLFGSDLQDLPVPWGLGPILQAELPPADKQLILRDNMAGMLERYSV